MDLGNGGHHLVRQRHIGGTDVQLQLLHRGRADNGRRHEGARQAEGKRHLRRVKAMVLGKRNIGGCRRLLFWHQPSADIAVDGAARSGRFGTVEIFARQNAAGKRRIGKQPDILVMRHFGHVEIEVAVEQAVFVLHGGNPRQPLLFGQGQEFLRAPGGLIGKAYGADLAGLHAGAERFQLFADFLKRARLVLSGRGVAPGAAEVEMAAVRPVHLVKVDIIGLQALKARIHSVVNGLGGDGSAAPDIGAAGAGHLGRQNHLVALAGLFEPVADQPFGIGIGFG